MTGDARAIEPFGFFTLDALRAGWYLLWRVVLFLLPFTLVPTVLAAGLAAWGYWLAAALAMLGGIVVAIAATVRITNRVAAAWTRAEYGRLLPSGVWWSVTWRVLLVSVPLSLLLTPLSLAFQGPLLVGGALDLVLPLVGLLLAAFYVVATLQAHGWALSTAIADRIGMAADAEPDDVEEPAPARPRPAPQRPAAARRPVAAAVGAPRTPARDTGGRRRERAAPAAPAAPSAAVQCPKCGLSETERGSVIGWYCRVCGWREKRG